MSEEDRYEHIDILIKSPDGEESWFDRIFDFITSFCTSEVEDECECGMQSMSGGGGTLDQCYDRMRLTEKWAMDVQAADLKLILSLLLPIILGDQEFRDSEQIQAAYERLRKAAYYHEDFEEWLANIPDDDEEDDLDRWEDDGGPV